MVILLMMVGLFVFKTKLKKAVNVQSPEAAELTEVPTSQPFHNFDEKEFKDSFNIVKIETPTVSKIGWNFQNLNTTTPTSGNSKTSCSSSYKLVENQLSSSSQSKVVRISGGTKTEFNSSSERKIETPSFFHARNFTFDK